jgi:hypothetical protein
MREILPFIRAGTARLLVQAARRSCGFDAAFSRPSEIRAHRR